MPPLPLLADADAGRILFVVLMVVLGLVGLALYFLPVVVAAMRSHHNTGAIFILTLLLGWSVIGWAVALVWAFTAVDRRRY